MNIEIYIKTDNAAFQEDKDQEVERILLEAVNKITDGFDHGYLRDYNGNRVGEFNIKED